MNGDEKKPTTFAAAMKHFFGLLAGQQLMAFSAELKGLTSAERAFFTKGLQANGYPLPDPA